MAIDVIKARGLVRKYFPAPIRVVMIDPYIDTIEYTIQHLDITVDSIDTDEKLVQFLDSIINGEVFYEIVRPVQLMFYEKRKKYEYTFMANEMDTSVDPPVVVRRNKTYMLNYPMYTSIWDNLDMRSMLTTVKMLYLFTNEALYERCPEFKVVYDTINSMLELDRIVQLKYRPDCMSHFSKTQDDILEDFRMINESVSKSTIGIFMMNNVSIAKTLLRSVYDGDITVSGLINGGVILPTESDRLNDPAATTALFAELWKSILQLGLFSMVAYYSVNYYNTMMKP
jgi:hypothetical protein